MLYHDQTESSLAAPLIGAILLRSEFRISGKLNERRFCDCFTCCATLCK